MHTDDLFVGHLNIDNIDSHRAGHIERPDTYYIKLTTTQTLYKIITGGDSKKVELEVNVWLGEGWKLSGGLSVSKGNGNTLYSQALTKEEVVSVH